MSADREQIRRDVDQTEPWAVNNLLRLCRFKLMERRRYGWPKKRRWAFRDALYLYRLGVRCVKSISEEAKLERRIRELERELCEAQTELRRLTECGATSWLPEGFAICRGDRGHTGSHLWEVQ